MNRSLKIGMLLVMLFMAVTLPAVVWAVEPDLPPILKINVQAGSASVKDMQFLPVTTEIQNVSKQDQTIEIWACSYSWNWKSDSSFAQMEEVPCDSNGLMKVALKPGESYKRNWRVHIVSKLAGAPLTFRLGFDYPYVPPSGEYNGPLARTWWSNPITIQVEP